MVHASLRASSVHPVVRVTGNFASEGPLSPPVREALLAAFDQGWADPKKLSQVSSRAAILRNQSIENIAAKLKIPAASIEVLGEPSLGHFLAISGYLRGGSTFAYSSIDKGKVRAIARSQGLEQLEIPTDQEGQIIFPDSLHVYSRCSSSGCFCRPLDTNRLSRPVDETRSRRAPRFSSKKWGAWCTGAR